MILADTTVLIDIERGRKGVRDAIIRHSPEETFAISAISIYEIYKGLGYLKQKYRSNNSVIEAHKSNIDAIIGDFEIIPVSTAILKAAGIRSGILKSKGIMLGIADLIIGITAEMMEAKAIMTRNGKHFEEFSCGIIAYKKN